MRSLCATLLLAIVLSRSAATDCSKDNWALCSDTQFFKQKTCSFPSPPRIGQEFELTITGEVSDTADSGTTNLKTYWSGIKVMDDTSSFCDSVKDYAPCPWTPGKELTFKFKTTIPSTAPGGGYREELRMKTSDGQMIFCLNGQFNL